MERSDSVEYTENLTQKLYDCLNDNADPRFPVALTIGILAMISMELQIKVLQNALTEDFEHAFQE